MHGLRYFHLMALTLPISAKRFNVHTTLVVFFQRKMHPSGGIIILQHNLQLVNEEEFAFDRNCVSHTVLKAVKRFSAMKFKLGSSCKI